MKVDYSDLQKAASDTYEIVGDKILLAVFYNNLVQDYQNCIEMGLRNGVSKKVIAECKRGLKKIPSLRNKELKAAAKIIRTVSRSILALQSNCPHSHIVGVRQVVKTPVGICLDCKKEWDVADPDLFFTADRAVKYEWYKHNRFHSILLSAPKRIVLQ